jgi:hypothetical protein
MEGKETQTSASHSTYPGQWRRRQRQRTSSPDQTPEQPSRSTLPTPTPQPRIAPMTDGSRNHQVVSCGPTTERPRVGVQWSRPRDASSSEPRPVRSAQQQSSCLARCPEQMAPRSRTQTQSTAAGSLQPQKAAPTTTQTVPPTRSRSQQRLLPKRRTQKHSTPAPCLEQQQRYPSSWQKLRPSTDRESEAWHHRKADPSIDANGLQFGPELVNDVFPLPQARNVPWPRYRHAAAKIGIGIESEFLLKARYRLPQPITSVNKFGKFVAENYNLQVPAYFPRMYSYMENQEISESGYHIFAEPRGFDEWSLTYDATMSTSQEPCKL